MNKQKYESPNAIHWTNIPNADGTRQPGYTWNPAAGCFHRCRWLMPGDKLAICYAEDVAHGIAKSAYPQGFEHHYWHPDRLEEPLKVKSPAGIFLDSMSDLMGTWVTDGQINQVLDVCRRAHWHTFFLLTKNAPRLAKFDFPDNVWVGVSSPPDYMRGEKLTRDQQEKMLAKSLKVLNKLHGVISWMSFEPLSWDVSQIVTNYPKALDWCVIGAASDGRTKHPPAEDHLKALLKALGDNTRVYFKGNLRSLPWANDNWREEFPADHNTPPLRKRGDKFQRGTSILEIIEVSITGGYLVKLNDSDESTPFPVTDDEITAWVVGKPSPVPAPVTPKKSIAIIPITAATTQRESTFRRRSLPINQIIHMDSLAYLQSLPSNSVHCMITSPPYWGLRDYGIDGQIGLEETLSAFVAKLVIIFREARRVLRDDGTLWINMGNSYASTRNGRSATDTKEIGNDNRTFRDKPFSTVGNGLKPKDLIGQPWRLAFALQDDGWYLRRDIIWHKLNPMPDSAKDRPGSAHEYVFLFSKSPKYYYDNEAVKQPPANSTIGRKPQSFGGEKRRDYTTKPTDPNYRSGHEQWSNIYEYDGGMVNLRSVWTIATQPYKEAHFATFPEALIEPMILAGCPSSACKQCGSPWTRIIEKEFIPQEDVSPERGIKGAPGQKPQYEDNQWEGVPRGTTQTKTIDWQPSCDCGTDTEPGVVLDMFMGSGTTGLVAIKNGRRYMGCDLNSEYVAMAQKRLSQPIEVDIFTSAAPGGNSSVPKQLSEKEELCQQSLL